MTKKVTEFAGTCLTMCSSSEVAFRISNGLVHTLECSDDTGSQKHLPDPRKMIKEYSRSAAGRNFLMKEELRPESVLEDTVDYLLQLFHSLKKEKLDVVYGFVVDRLRAVRQDMVVQRLDPKTLLEKMLPFFVESEYLCRTTTCSSYDWKLHTTQMEDCFSTWSTCLEAENKFGQDILFMHFFRSYKDEKKMIKLLPYFKDARRSTVLQIYSSLVASNYVRFFRLLSQLDSPLLKQSMSQLAHDVRLHSLYTVSLAYKSRGATLPVSHIQSGLHLSSSPDSIPILSHFFPIENNCVCINSFDNSKKIPPIVDFLLFKSL